LSYAPANKRQIIPVWTPGASKKISPLESFVCEAEDRKGRGEEGKLRHRR